MSRNGETVRAFESAFAAYVGARYAIAMTNGTVTLEVALRALGVGAGDRVATTPLTMAATTIAILNVGAVPVYCDVDPATWLMDWDTLDESKTPARAVVPVSLYGLHNPDMSPRVIDDAAQTLRQHGGSAFSSFSFQRSKILNTGEGGMLVTNDERLAIAAREIASLGYQLSATQSRIDSHAIRSPDFARHHRYPSMNARMNDLTAAEGLMQLAGADILLSRRDQAAAMYADAIDGCPWLLPQSVPEGWTHSWWSYAVAADTKERALTLAAAIERHGGERPYFAWRLTYQEPAFRHLAPDGTCPIAESLQPRILAFQGNDLASAERNAAALRLAIQEIGA